MEGRSANVKVDGIVAVWKCHICWLVTCGVGFGEWVGGRRSGSTLKLRKAIRVDLHNPLNVAANVHNVPNMFGDASGTAERVFIPHNRWPKHSRWNLSTVHSQERVGSSFIMGFLTSKVSNLQAFGKSYSDLRNQRTHDRRQQHDTYQWLCNSRYTRCYPATATSLYMETCWTSWTVLYFHDFVSRYTPALSMYKFSEYDKFSINQHNLYADIFKNFHILHNMCLVFKMIQIRWQHTDSFWWNENISYAFQTWYIVIQYNQRRHRFM